MPEMIRKLEQSDIDFGLLYLGDLKSSLPAPSEPVTVIDSDGEEFRSKMHSAQPRIDGLTALHQKHGSTVNQTVNITVHSHEPRVLRVFFQLRAEDADQDSPYIRGNLSSQGIDRRQVVERQIRLRRGQKTFRESLRKLYGDRCMVTGCRTLAVLEAAHISPYLSDNDNHPENGLLLRCDIHTLFDLDLLGIQPDSLRVELHPGVVDEYGALVGVTLCCRTGHRPSQDALKPRYKRFLGNR